MDDRFYCDNMGVEYKDYSIFDLFKAEKKLKDFSADDNKWYDGEKFDEYLIEDTDSIMTGEQVVTLLNTYFEERNYFEEKKEYFLSKWSIVHTDNLQLVKENKELKKKLTFEELESEEYNIDAMNYQTLYYQQKEKNQELIENLKLVLPIIACIDYKLSISECKAINKLARLIQDDFFVGVDCNQKRI